MEANKQEVPTLFCLFNSLDLGYLREHECDNVMKHLQYHRPLWTAGKYNPDRHAAIIYNLIEGQSHFFEDVSADVVGRFLGVKRGVCFSPEELLADMRLPSGELEGFLATLQSLGLLLPGSPSDVDENAYRKRVAADRRKNMAAIPDMDDAVETNDTAERAYFDAVASPATVASVMLELTYNCSERCLHCYNPGATRNETERSGRGDREELTLADHKRVIDELCALGLVKVCLSGGDPFSHPAAWDIIDYLHEREIATDIFTNGLALEGQERRLASCYPRLVGISLYSGVAADHERMTRVKGSWARTVGVMERLGDLAVPLNLKCCVTRVNVKSYYTVKPIAERTGALAQFELNITDGVDGDKCASRRLRLTPEEMEIVLTDDYIARSQRLREIDSGEVSPALEGKICGAGHDSFCVTPEGNLQPCCAFPLMLGNVREETVAGIISRSAELRRWRETGLQDLTECYRHDYCAYCRICPGNNQVANGNPVAPSENNCALAKIKLDFCLKRREGRDPLDGKTLEERLSGLDDYNDTLHRERE